MVITDDGRQVGSVSGGCVVEGLVERLRAGYYSGEHPELIEYGVSAAENERLGLSCGGPITLLLWRLTEPERPWLSDALAALEKRCCLERYVNLTTGTTTLVNVDHFTSLDLDE